MILYEVELKKQKCSGDLITVLKCQTGSSLMIYEGGTGVILTERPVMDSNNNFTLHFRLEAPEGIFNTTHHFQDFRLLVGLQAKLQQ